MHNNGRSCGQKSEIGFSKNNNTLCVIVVRLKVKVGTWVGRMKTVTVQEYQLANLASWHTLWHLILFPICCNFSNNKQQVVYSHGVQQSQRRKHIFSVSFGLRVSLTNHSVEPLKCSLECRLCNEKESTGTRGITLKWKRLFVCDQGVLDSSRPSYGAGVQRVIHFIFQGK
jgi:hypothetical protein